MLQSKLLFSEEKETEPEQLAHMPLDNPIRFSEVLASVRPLPLNFGRIKHVSDMLAL